MVKEMAKDLIIRCKGLPYACTEDDLRKFFGDSGIDNVDISMRDGKATGHATVIFNNDCDYNEALKKDKEHMGHRYIEVFPADDERDRRGGGGGGQPRYFNNDRGDRRSGGGGRDRRDSYGYSSGPPQRGGGGDGFGGAGANGEGVVRLRGLPFNARERDVFDFFAPLPMLPDGVLLPDERNAPKSNGEAYVVFEDMESASMALQRHMKNMQHRYIEVFEAGYDEMVRFCQDNRIRVPRPGPLVGGGGPPGGYGGGPPSRGPGGYGGDYGGGPGGYGGAPPQGGPPDRYGPPGGGYQSDRRGPAPFDGGYGPPPAAAMPERDPYARDAWGPGGGPGPRGPEPPIARGPPQADSYGRPDPYARAPIDRDPYGRGVPVAEDPYAAPAPRRVYSPEDPYSRPPARGPDPYERTPAAPAVDPYGRGSADPYGRSPGAGPETWRDERQAPPATVGYGDGVGSGGGGAGGAWDGYGYGSDYRQSVGGGAMRREREPAAAVGAWRDEPREAPRGRERPGQKYVLKMRGVPFRAVEADVYEFFEPIRPARVEIVREPGGRPSGEARVEFDSRKDYDDALLKDKQYMGPRYVELFPDFGGRY